VPPHKFSQFHELIEILSLKTKLMIKNLQDDVDNETPIKRGKAAEDMNWTEYHDTSVIYEWLDALQREFPTIISVIDIGNSYEGTPIKLVKLSKKSVIEKA
jgi:hypothetical protein